MSNCVYVTATEANSGKSAVCLGIMEMLIRKIGNVGFFRPIIKSVGSRKRKDPDIDLILSYFDIDIPDDQTIAYTSGEAGELISSGREEELIVGIIDKFNSLKDRFDFILCEGTDFESSTAAFEFDINSEIIRNLGAPVLLVARGMEKSADETIRSIELALDSLEEKGCRMLSTIINRTEIKKGMEIIDLLEQKKHMKDQLIYCIPEEELLGKPTMKEIADHI